jgi:hydroxymethylglutaryl-CoA reductase
MSDWSHFYKKSIKERRTLLQRHHLFESQEVESFTNGNSLSENVADSLIENYVGNFSLPMGLATNFIIDNKPYTIPMAVEETSIIAAVSATAKWVCRDGEITTCYEKDYIIGQIHLQEVKNAQETVDLILHHKSEIIENANTFIPSMVERGGGVFDISVRALEQNEFCSNVIIHLLCNTQDAMGANIINQVSEKISPFLEKLTGYKPFLRILSNYSKYSVARATVEIWNVQPEIARKIENVSKAAHIDTYRAVTHNKGIMNGVDPILIATGNDWRAAEAAAHAHAARFGQYQALSTWKSYGDNLKGTIEIPLRLGIVGGVTSLHPQAKMALKVLDVKSASELARVACAVGLVQNLAALKALATDGIVKGHMKLHAKNLALLVADDSYQAQRLTHELENLLVEKKSITLSDAKEIYYKISS